jgi:hypothetical protein
MVRIHPDPPDARAPPVHASSGAIAQLGERLLCKQEVIGSIPIGSTSNCTSRNQQSTARARLIGVSSATKSHIGCSLKIWDRR